MHRKAIGPIGLGDPSPARHDDHNQKFVKVLTASDLIENPDGKEARVTIAGVPLAPGVVDKPHHLPRTISGHALEGEYELALGRPTRESAESRGHLLPANRVTHRVFRNPNTKNCTRVLAEILHDGDAKSSRLRRARGES